MPEVRRTIAAANDVQSIWRYIAVDNVAAADRLVDEIERVLTLIAQFPDMGESVEHLRRGARRLNVGNYQLFCEKIRGGIRLLRVYHAARSLDGLFDEI
jgi:toxin ParE1/3/4